MLNGSRGCRAVFFFIFITFLSAAAAEARVFDFNDRAFATYLRGTFGMDNLQQTAYAPGFPSSISFSGNMNQAFSGEFGFSYTSSKYMTFRFGAEVLYPLPETGLAGNDASGTKQVSLDSQVYSIIPQVNVEMFIKHWNLTRLYLGVGVGYAITTIKNTVTAVSGNSLGISDYIEEGTSWGIMGQGYLGYEFQVFDQVTLSLDAGYRYLTVSNYTANRPFTSPAGTFAVGNQLKNYDGTNRSTDLSGLFGALTFRFYIE